jgi:hypothetical protein
MLCYLTIFSAFIISTYITIVVSALDDKYSYIHCIQQNDQNNDSTVCTNKVFNFYNFPFVINNYNNNDDDKKKMKEEDISSSEIDDTKLVEKDDKLYLISAGMRRKNLFVVEVDVYRVGKYNKSSSFISIISLTIAILNSISTIIIIIIINHNYYH